MKNVLKYILTFVLMVIMALGLLLISSCIPRVFLRNNVRISANELKRENEKFIVKSFDKRLLFHNSTDAIMINITYGIDENDKLESVIKARRNYIPGVKQDIVEDKNGNLVTSNNKKFSMVKELNELVNNNEEQDVLEYVRYWHGYVVILRILLVFFDVLQIRIIFQLMLYAFLALLMVFLFKKNKGFDAILVLLSFVILDISTWENNIQGMFVMLISVLVSLLIVKEKISKNNFTYSMFITGAVVAYLDFLTVPLVSILMPLIIYNIVNEDNESLKELLIRFIKVTISWGIGYIGLWAAKWVISDMIYGTDMIKLGLNQILIRSGINEENIKFIPFALKAVKNNVLCINGAIMWIVLIITGITTAVYGFKNGIRIFINKENLIYFISILAVYAWYIIFANHSEMHYFFTYRLQLVSVLSLLLITLGSIIKNLNKNKDKKVDVND